MERIQIVISLLGTLTGMSVTLCTVIIKFSKNKKLKRMAEESLKLGSEAMKYIEKAETFLHYTGSEKKEYVITKLNQYAKKNKLNMEEEEIGKRIEELVALTKKVNARSANPSYL